MLLSLRCASHRALCISNSHVALVFRVLVPHFRFVVCVSVRPRLPRLCVVELALCCALGVRVALTLSVVCRTCIAHSHITSVECARMLHLHFALTHCTRASRICMLHLPCAFACRDYVSRSRVAFPLRHACISSRLHFVALTLCCACAWFRLRFAFARRVVVCICPSPLRFAFARHACVLHLHVARSRFAFACCTCFCVCFGALALRNRMSRLRCASARQARISHLLCRSRASHVVFSFCGWFRRSRASYVARSYTPFFPSLRVKVFGTSVPPDERACAMRRA